MTELIAADIGGTNARFARATLDARGTPTLGAVRKYKVADHPNLAACWQRFAADEGGKLPDKASIAFAAPIAQEVIKLTNSSWTIRPAQLAQELGLAQVRLVNDFAAVAHAVARLPNGELPLLFGPDTPFAPLDGLEAQMLDLLRQQYRRVSTERICAGPGLNNLYRALATLTHEKVELLSDADLWSAALDGSNALARQALERFCLSLGSVAGDLALAHGPKAVVLAGGLTQRMRDFLVNESGFHSRFTAKGRYEALMRTIPVRLATHPEIGLYGAAAAYRESRTG
ncbi:MAG: glucokinase [Sphingomonadales bacterium]|nr:glucokinase [Sphingomonadales bacterium]